MFANYLSFFSIEHTTGAGKYYSVTHSPASDATELEEISPHMSHQLVSTPWDDLPTQDVS